MPRVQAHELTPITDADLQSDEPQYGPTSLPTRGAAPRQRGDVIDQLAARRGDTLPARDAAIKRSFTEADFPTRSQTVGGGFWGNDTHGFKGAFAPILHPWDTIDRTLDAAQRIGTNEVPAPSGHDALRDLSTATAGMSPTSIPTMIADTAQESYARGERGQSTSDLYGGAAGMAVQAGAGYGLSKIPVRALAGAAGRKVGILPPEYGPDAINRAIGPGAVDTQRRIDVGKALAETSSDMGTELDSKGRYGDPIEPPDPKAVRRNPRLLVDHVQQILDRENLAADQLLQSPEAQRPAANGPALLRGVKNTALLTDADRAAATSVREYVTQKIDELSQKHGGNGAISIADADVIKRELQSRANYDKIFGNTALTTTDNLRNQLLSDYASRFDSLGDTLPGYAKLNQRRSSLIHYRDNVLYPSVDNAITGTTVPSRTGAGIRTAASAIHGNPLGVVKGVNDMVAARTPVVDPFRIAKAIQQQVSAARAAGIQSPTAQILADAQPTILDAPAASSIPGRAQFAAGSDGGGAFPVDARPDAVAAAMPPTGPSAFSTALEPAIDRAANATAATARTAGKLASDRLSADRARTDRPALSPAQSPEWVPTGDLTSSQLRNYKALPARSSPSVQPSSGVVFEADTPNNPAFWRERTGVTPRGVSPSRSGPVRADHIDRAAATRADLDRVIAERKVDAPFRAARTEVRPNRATPTANPEVPRIQFGKDGRMTRPTNIAPSGASELPTRPAAPAVNPNSYEGVKQSFDKRNALVGEEAQRNTDARPTRAAKHAAQSAEPTSPADFKVEPGNDVRFSIGNARRHGRVTKLVDSKAGPAVEIQTPDRGTYTVLVSKLTRLERPAPD